MLSVENWDRRVFYGCCGRPSAGFGFVGVDVELANVTAQTIWVTEGVVVCQREDGPIELVRPGDRVFFEPGDHWHGAAPTRFMTHLAIQQANEAGEVVAWGEHVSDEQYSQTPSLEARCASTP